MFSEIFSSQTDVVIFHSLAGYNIGWIICCCLCEMQLIL